MRNKYFLNMSRFSLGGISGMMLLYFWVNANVYERICNTCLSCIRVRFDILWEANLRYSSMVFKHVNHACCYSKVVFVTLIDAFTRYISHITGDLGIYLLIIYLWRLF